MGAVVLSLALLFSACGGQANPALPANGGNGSGADGSEPNPTVAVERREPVEISVLCAGDVMTHMSQVNAAYNSASDTYDFSDNYTYVSDYISGADLALCNVETTFAGKPYTGYPGFSGPDELAANLASAGFDVAMTANNHMYDKRGIGLYRTLEVCRAAGLTTTGSRLGEYEARYAMNEAKGLRIATISYTYETPSNGGVSLNSIPVSSADIPNINSYKPGDIWGSTVAIGETVVAAKEAGADIVILYLHWGEEYQLSSNQAQRQLAQSIADSVPDVDVIFASHPHNLQEFAWLDRSFNSNSVSTLPENGGSMGVAPDGVAAPKLPVFYSLGNFISNQRVETLGDDKWATEIGAMGIAHLTYDPERAAVTEVSVDCVPTWVDRYSAGGGYHYSIIPLDDTLDSNPTLAASGHLARAQRAKERAYGILNYQF